MHSDGTVAEKVGPKLQVLENRKRWFHGVLVTEIVRLFGDSQFGIAAVEPKPPALWSNKAADNPQERRFPRAIAAGHGQGLAPFQPKADAGKDLPAAAAAGQIDGV
jgi:hypothetical protein